LFKVGQIAPFVK